VSALWPHARALRVLGEELFAATRDPYRPQNSDLIFMLANAHIAAADRLDREIAINSARRDSGPYIQEPARTKG